MTRPNTSLGHCTAKGKSKTYRAWASMRARCNNPKDARYPGYGGRGITVCSEWDSFAQFLADMGEAPEDKSLDRQDNSKGYSKDNCHWATPLEQQQNTRRNRNLTFNGETHCVDEWTRRLGFGVDLIISRLNYGWSVEKALTTPSTPREECGAMKWVTFKGETLSVAKWARRVGINTYTVYKRLANGWSTERALTTPAIRGSNQYGVAT